VLRKVKTELERKEKVRDKAHQDIRKATSLSKQTILFIHQKRFLEAQEAVEKAKSLIAELQSLSNSCPNIVYGGMFSAALQEYSEANIFLKMTKDDELPSPEEINVPYIEYVLGLADVIGEFRRLSLDALREGNVEKGEKCLRTMDEIFVELLALDETYMLVPGLRRKSDISRRIIEATRGDITQEVRRKSLEDHIIRLELHSKSQLSEKGRKIGQKPDSAP
jgi:translin